MSGVDTSEDCYLMEYPVDHPKDQADSGQKTEQGEPKHGQNQAGGFVVIGWWHRYSLMGSPSHTPLSMFGVGGGTGADTGMAVRPS